MSSFLHFRDLHTVTGTVCNAKNPKKAESIKNFRLFSLFEFQKETLNLW